MPTGSHLACRQGELRKLPEIVSGDFPSHATARYFTNLKPLPGDLCLVEADGCRFYGHFQPLLQTSFERLMFRWLPRWYRPAAAFSRPGWIIEAKHYRVIGVLRPTAQAEFAVCD